MVGIVVVSHSDSIASGVVELARQVAGDVAIEAAGGGPGGELGTDESRVREALRRADHGDGVVVVADLGSAVLTIRHILEDGDARIRLADAPLVEGAVAAAVVASTGAALSEVAGAAEEARHVSKL